MESANEAKDDVLAVSEREASRRLSISAATLRSWRSRRYGPKFVRLGRRVAYRLTDLRAFLNDSVDRDTLS